MNSDQLVIGYGQVGQAIQKILNCHWYDPSGASNYLEGKYGIEDHRYRVLHICFPYGKHFINDVEDYRIRFKPDFIIVHSTVPVGTSALIGDDVVHSPIRGVHPDLELGVRTFTKFFGGPRAKQAAEIFAKLGIRVKTTAFADDTEAMKLWDTTQYGAMIMLNKEIRQYCKERGLDFDIVYTEANRTYNEGYQELGRPEVVRPYLKHVPGPIGGHCVMPNAELLNSPAALDLIKKNNSLSNGTAKK